jgi:hypothetical protein
MHLSRAGKGFVPGQNFVAGDAANVAARLQQVASPGGVLLSDATYRMVKDAVVVEPVEPLRLKGKEQSVRAWKLIDAHPLASMARRLDSPLVGRTKDLRMLAQAFESAVTERACYLFTLLGSAGTGKSRVPSGAYQTWLLSAIHCLRIES